MDDKKQEDTTPVSAVTTTDETVISEVTESVEGETTPVTESVINEVVETNEVARKSFNIGAYVGAVALILVICTGLVFVLEKEGRISTGLFTTVISKMESKEPAARVNDIEISKGEFNSSVQQLTEMASTQGADASDPAMAAQFKTQAIDTLVNAELLRQAAVSEGMTTTEEQITTRFNEIRDGIGGADKLAAKMAEFGVTEESLLRNIENEFLTQGLFGVKIKTDTIEVSETEVKAFYDKAIAVNPELPPLAEVRDKVVEQIRFEKEQALINTYLQTLKEGAKIEILI